MDRILQGHKLFFAGRTYVWLSHHFSRTKQKFGQTLNFNFDSKLLQHKRTFKRSSLLSNCDLAYGIFTRKFICAMILIVIYDLKEIGWAWCPTTGFCRTWADFGRPDTVSANFMVHICKNTTQQGTPHEAFSIIVKRVKKIFGVMLYWEEYWSSSRGE